MKLTLLFFKKNKLTLREIQLPKIIEVRIKILYQKSITIWSDKYFF